MEDLFPLALESLLAVRNKLIASIQLELLANVETWLDILGELSRLESAVSK